MILLLMFQEKEHAHLIELHAVILRCHGHRAHPQCRGTPRPLTWFLPHIGFEPREGNQLSRMQFSTRTIT